jgi:poly(A) polymerase
MGNIYHYAMQIVKTLTDAGYIAYFAGGWVRDFLLHHPSEDIDIATNAPTEAIIELFPKTILVGLSFGVVIVSIGGHQFEVTTFRKDLEYKNGRQPEKIELSTPLEDALRRDFTINGMFYDPLNDRLYDFVEGQRDLEQGIIRAIGNPHERFAEDRLRMIRAVRFAARFGFQIDPETQKAIQAHASTLLPAVAMERIWQEFQKMTKTPRFDEAILAMHHLGLLPVIFPSMENVEPLLLRQRIAIFRLFPPGTPPILYLMELFPHMESEEILEIASYLKVSGHDSKLVEYACKGKRVLAQEKEAPQHIEKLQWAKFYADRFFHLCFDIIAARYPESEYQNLIDTHQARREHLLPHIQRLMDKKPLVTATMLKDYGIAPGKQMGALLREAERIAVEEDLHDPIAVIAKLQQLPLWRQER